MRIVTDKVNPASWVVQADCPYSGRPRTLASGSLFYCISERDRITEEEIAACA